MRSPRARDRDPYEGLPVDELAEPVLPRWFVLALLASVPVAVILFVVAFFGLGQEPMPVAERRPPPADGLSSDTGELVVSESSPTPHTGVCPAVDGVGIAGAGPDRSTLAAALDGLCPNGSSAIPARHLDALAELAADGVVVRFAAFEHTHVDVASDAGTVFVNARYAQLDPRMISPLILYEAVLREAPVVDAAAVREARAAEAAACAALQDEPSRACEDAATLLGLEDPIASLRAAGFE